MKNLAPYSAGYSDVDVSIVDYDMRGTATE